VDQASASGVRNGEPASHFRSARRGSGSDASSPFTGDRDLGRRSRNAPLKSGERSLSLVQTFQTSTDFSLDLALRLFCSTPKQQHASDRSERLQLVKAVLGWSRVSRVERSAGCARGTTLRSGSRSIIAGRGAITGASRCLLRARSGGVVGGISGGLDRQRRSKGAAAHRQRGWSCRFSRTLAIVGAVSGAASLATRQRREPLGPFAAGREIGAQLAHRLAPSRAPASSIGTPVNRSRSGRQLGAAGQRRG
jgi:hypothetical protein